MLINIAVFDSTSQQFIYCLVNSMRGLISGPLTDSSSLDFAVSAVVLTSAVERPKYECNKYQFAVRAFKKRRQKLLPNHLYTIKIIL